MSLRKRTTALAATTALAGLATLGLTAPAQATDAGPAATASPSTHSAHYVNGSSVWAGGCHGYLNDSTYDGYHVQGVVYDQERNGGETCVGWLEVKHGSGNWVSYGHTSGGGPLTDYGPGEWDATGFVYDGPNYLARACVKEYYDGGGESSWYCGASF